MHVVARENDMRNGRKTVELHEPGTDRHEAVCSQDLHYWQPLPSRNVSFEASAGLSINMEFPLYQVDAFAAKPFSGNPAAVVLVGSQVGKVACVCFR